MTHHCIKPWWKRLRFGEIGWQPVISPACWGIECKSPEVEKYLRNICPDSEAGKGTSLFRVLILMFAQCGMQPFAG